MYVYEENMSMKIVNMCKTVQTNMYIHDIVAQCSCFLLMRALICFSLFLLLCLYTRINNK